MLNVLFVSCYSVDINNSASIELIYYMNLLAESGEFNIHLLTMNFPRSSIYYDKDISLIVHKNIKIHRVSGGSFLNKMLPKTCDELKSNYGVRNSILISIKNLTNVIDPYLSWSYRAYKYFKKNIYNLSFDIILGMHEPPSSLICSCMIRDFLVKKGNHVRLISYFSDPYCDEPNRKLKNFLFRRINEVIEKKIVNKSEKFLFVTEKNSEYFLKKYSIDNKDIGIVHRNFGSEFMNRFKGNYPNQFIKDKINLLHAGDIVKGIRDVSEFINSLDFIQKNYKDHFVKLNINFYGNIKDDIQSELVKNKDYIKSGNRISYFKIVNLMTYADVLIIFGNKEFNQIPAKVYDCLSTNAYIFVVLESYDDPLYHLVKNVEGVVCVLNNADDISKALLMIVEKFEFGCKTFNRNKFKSGSILGEIKKVFYD